MLRHGIRPPCVDWGPRLQKLEQKLHKISTLPISAFGRAFAASSYALSSILNTAEFAGPPPGSDINMVEQQVAALVDAKRSPNDQSRRGFCALSAENQLGRPLTGGFGVLPLRHHIMARHAVWAVRLAKALLADRVPPWATIAQSVVATLRRNTLTSGRNGIADMFFYKPTPAEKRKLPPLLRLMFQALNEVPRPRVLANVALPVPSGPHDPK